MRFSCSLVLLIWSAVSLLPAAEPGWWQFLGPDRNGISTEKGLNTNWDTQQPKTLWKVPLGSGCSSMTIVDKRIYTMAKRDKRDLVICLDATTGKEIWTYDAAPSYIDTQRWMAGPRATPTYHDGRLYCQMANGELHCISNEGKLIWQADIFKDTGAPNQSGAFYYWGVAFSPLVEGDLVVVQPGGNKDNSVVAFHKNTGKLVWSAGKEPLGYASPIAVDIAGTRQIVCPTGQAVLGLEPTKGTILWRYEFGNKYNATCSTPVWSDSLLFVSAAYKAGSAALEITKDGDKWNVKEKWKKDHLQNIFATSAILDGFIYGFHGDLGAISLRCLDIKSGEMKWEQRHPARSSLLAVSGHLICLDERGGLRLVESSPKAYNLKGEMKDLLEPKAWAQPVVLDGKLYVRDEKHLLCLELKP